MGRKKIRHYLIPERSSQRDTIASICKMLDLEGVARSFENIAERINQSHGILYDFLASILEKEMVYKEENRIERWTQQARFCYKRTIEEFDFDFQPSIDRRLINELATCRFIEKGKNIIFVGKPGVGKTHLAIGLGLEAINSGYETRFLKLDEFIDRVEEEKETHSTAKIFKMFVRPHLLILDDIDFYQTGENAGTVLFRLICRRYETGVSTIFTSNKNSSEWGKLFGPPQRATAALDRIIGNAIAIKITGPSYRVSEKVKNGEIIGEKELN